MVDLHGLRKHPITSAWYHMKYRCYNVDCPEYKHYGGRGIIMCEEWKEDFFTFFNWSINNGWIEGLTIDRIDVNGNYEPSNCRWVSQLVQQNNKRNITAITFNGKTQTEARWCCELGVYRGTITRRLNNGWTIEEALTTPSRKSKSNKVE